MTRSIGKALRWLKNSAVPVTFWGLMALGLLALQPGQEPLDLENGMGGPAESPLGSTRLASPDLSRLDPDFGQAGGSMDLLAGTWLASDLSPRLGSDELGPLGRAKSGTLELRIRPRQTFYETLTDRGVPHGDIMTLVRACRSFRNLSTVRAGEVFRMELAADGGLRSLGFDLDEESFVTWVREGDTYVRQDGTYPVEHLLKGLCGSIETSLYSSLQKLEAPLALAPKMNDILGWDIDFSRDLRQGDTFRILYEEVWKEGQFIRTGPILAAEIFNRGRSATAYRFSTEDGRPHYYDRGGNNLQKQLMRAPLEYSRISSGFSYRRFHPVLKRWMPHLGVDYAAPLGTPVRAAGDGTILTMGRKKGNGRYIKIRHTNREYETYYLHFSRFAKGLREGSRVTQGQVIGFVGATGYATGPHLDYRVKRNGKFVNPRKLKLPAAAPVADHLKPRFAALSQMYVATLADLPNETTPVPVPPVIIIEPPAWDGLSFAVAHLPETIRR